MNQLPVSSRVMLEGFCFDCNNPICVNTKHTRTTRFYFICVGINQGKQDTTLDDDHIALFIHSFRKHEGKDEPLLLYYLTFNWRMERHAPRQGFFLFFFKSLTTPHPHQTELRQPILFLFVHILAYWQNYMQAKLATSSSCLQCHWINLILSKTEKRDILQKALF